MKYIHKGLVYDTDKSDIIYEEPSGRRTYYATKKSRYFIVYKTGEFSTVSEDTVREILLNYNYEEYCKRFGTPEEA